MHNWTQIEMTRAKWFLDKLEYLSNQLGEVMNDEYALLLKLEKVIDDKSATDHVKLYHLLEQKKLDCWFYRSVYDNVKTEYEVLFNRKLEVN